MQVLKPTAVVTIWLASAVAGVAQDTGVQGVVVSPDAEIAAAENAALPGLLVYAGIAATSNYVSDGVTQTNDNPALQGYLEFDASGFYGGAWMSNVDFPGDDDSVELDLYAGYRNTMQGGIAYDLGYYRYLYNDTGDCCGEFIGVLSGQTSDKLAIEGQVTWDPESPDYSLEVSPEFNLNDFWSISATLGYKHSYDGVYGDIGATWSISDAASLDIRYTDAQNDDAPGIFYATISFDTTLFQ